MTRHYIYCYINFLFILQWATFLDSEGRVMDSKALRKRIFYGGVEHSLRKEVCIYNVFEIKLSTGRFFFYVDFRTVNHECRSGHSC